MCVCVCVQFTGIAAQDFTTDGGPFKATRKWEQFPKNMHKAYVWTKFKVPPRIWPEGTPKDPSNLEDGNEYGFDFARVDVSPTPQDSRQHVPHDLAGMVTDSLLLHIS